MNTSKTFLRLMTLILALSVVCITAGAQKIEVSKSSINRTETGFVVKGTAIATDLNPEGQIVDSDYLNVVAYVKEGPSSQYPKLPESQLLYKPEGAETNWVKGSGPGETMTKAEYEGMGIAKVNVATVALRPRPVPQNAPATVTKDFEGSIPLQYEGKEVMIVATLNHQWSLTYPAFFYAHAIVYEGQLESLSTTAAELETALVINATSSETIH
jgi:hypothetical protein